MNARDAILGAVRQALAGSPDPVPHAPAYRRHGELGADARVERFLSRLADYNVHVTVVKCEADVAGAVAQRLAACGVTRIAAPEDLPTAWRPTGVEIVGDRALDARGLDTTPACITGCAFAIAETGSIVLDSGAAQGRRALTLLPDHHLCVVFADQLVETVPDAIQALGPTVRERRPLTIFSGPSATADIEFDRVLGVHGPRVLDVTFVDHDREALRQRDERASRANCDRVRSRYGRSKSFPSAGRMAATRAYGADTFACRVV
jgi:L-lactate dehydrogenase complex protein LldG